MFVMNASFEADKKFEDRLMDKAKKTQDEAQEAEGIISFECWRRDHGETVEYVLVSKWENQSNFKAWISREDHIQEHKEMRQKQAKGEQDEFKPKKRLHSFEAVHL